jgi:hypothetical protein
MGLSFFGGGSNERTQRPNNPRRGQTTTATDTTNNRRRTAPGPTTTATDPRTGEQRQRPAPLPSDGISNRRPTTGDPVGRAQPREGATAIGDTAPPGTGASNSSAIGAAQVAALRQRRRAGASTGSLLTGLNVRPQSPAAQASLVTRRLVGA